MYLRYMLFLLDFCRVDFSSNLITNITYTTFGDMSMIYTLNLAHNHIEAVKDYSFSSGKFLKLKVLLLKENYLSQLNDLTFFGLDIVEYLDLGANRIRSIGPGTFDVSAVIVYTPARISEY